MGKLLSRTSYFILSFAAVLIIYVAYLLFWPYKTIVFEKDSFQTIKQTYVQGEQFSYRVHYEKFINIPATVIRAFSDGILFQMPVTQTHNPVGKQNFINTSVMIPENLPPGRYVMKMSIVYHVNSLRDIVHNVETNEFEVISK